MRAYFSRLIVLALLATLAACNRAEPPPADATATADADAAAAREKQALEAGVEAAVYGLPLVIMDLTRAKTTNVPHPQGFAAPVNQFAQVRAFPDASFKDIVRANVDTLYSAAFLDLSAEPLVLTVPDTKGRYYLMPMLDAWTNVFASPGKRTTGTKAGTFAITGPGWTGTLPAGVTELKSPTNMAWIIGRTQTNGPDDYAAVHAIQDGYRLVPLSSFGKPYTPPEATVDPNFDMKTAPVDQLKAMSSVTFFSRLAALLASNPPPAAEAPVLDKLASIGVVPGQPFDPSRLDSAVARGLEQSLPAAIAKLEAASKQAGAPVNGWRVPSSALGNYGTDYGTRAVVSLVGLGANLVEDAVYPSAFVDNEGKPLNGGNRYVIHFDKGAMPPVQAFWSITMYDAQSFFVPNSINRYAVSSWMPLQKNADGSLDIHVQAQSPGKDSESNWLPAPAGDFNLTLRMYWPTEKAPTIMDGSWQPPAVTRLQ
jgi:hypothetical protein